MKAHLSFIVTISSLLASTFARAEPVWQIQAISASKAIQCTASLIKTNDRCALLTAAHCLPDNFTSLKIQNEESTVLRKSRFFDLAEISIPSSMAQTVEKECAGSAVDEPKGFPNSQASLSATGYVSGALIKRYTKNLDWNDGYEGFGEIGIQFTANSFQDYLYAIKDLFIVPGMSGGLVQDQSGSVVGMVSQFVPMTGILYAIPIGTIHRFVGGEMPAPELEKLSGIPTLSEYLSRNNSTRGAGADGHAGGGADGHAGGGADGHAGGGADGHAGGGADGHASGDLMALFREPVEGIDDPESPGKRLMAVNGKQIDGTDDYALIYLSLEPADRARAKKIFEQDRLSRGILSRMDGYYNVSIRDFGKEMLYRQETLADYGDLLGDVVVDAKKKKIMLIFRPPGHVELRISGVDKAQEKIVWDVVTDSSGMPLRLVSGPTTLQCDTREYLQLLCSNADIELSLSLNEDRQIVKADDWLPPKLHFRYTRRLNLQGKTYYDYRFGDGVDMGYDATEAWKQ